MKYIFFEYLLLFILFNIKVGFRIRINILPLGIFRKISNLFDKKPFKKHFENILKVI